MINFGITLLLFFLLGFYCAHLFQISTKQWAMWDKKVGWQFHHSLFGVMLLLVPLFFPQFSAQFIGAGIGIIAEHSIKCGFVFIKRW